MKKIINEVVLVVLCISLFGCGKSSNEEKIGTATLFVECSTILNNMDKLDDSVKEYIPESGIIMEKRTVDIIKGDSVYDILSREFKKENILMEVSFTGKSAYVEGLDNIYEFSCGELSGWTYSVNGKYMSKSCSEYKVKANDSIEWHYTCELGEDLKN